MASIFRSPSTGISLDDIMKVVASLDEAAFGILERYIKGPDSFERDGASVAALAGAIGADVANVQVLIDALGYLYEEVGAGAGGTTLERFLGDALKDLPPDVLERAAVRFGRLLGPNEGADRASRLRRLRDDGPTAVLDFEPIVDLRPAFSDDGGRMLGLASVVRMRIFLDDGAAGEVNVRLDERSLASLKKAVATIERRLELVRAVPTFAAMMKDYR